MSMKAVSAILDSIQEPWTSLVPCVEECERSKGELERGCRQGAGGVCYVGDTLLLSCDGAVKADCASAQENSECCRNK